MQYDYLVSIIIPVYNVEPYIEESLCSAVGQTYSNLEIIIIDDGSTDNSGKICDDFASRDKRIKVIHQENRGLSAARNAGLDIAQGDYIAFLDSDDAYATDFIEQMISAMLQEQADIVMCRYYKIRTADSLYSELIASGEAKADRNAVISDTITINPPCRPGVYDRAGALREMIDGRINYAVWNKVYDRSVWQDIRFAEGRNYEDIDSICRILDTCRKMAIIDKPMYMYRDRPDSIINTASFSNKLDMIAASAYFVSYIEAHTPAIFSYEQLDRLYKTYLDLMIGAYGRYFSTGDTDLINKLRSRIVIFGKEHWTDKYGIKTSTGYHMIDRCPGLFRFMYKAYRPAHTILKSIKEKRFH